MSTVVDRVYPLAARDLQTGKRVPFSRVPRRTRNMRDPLRAVRRPPDPFSLLDTAADALRVNEHSLVIARSLVQSIDGAPVDEALLGALAVVPPNNLSSFKRRGGRIFFADTFLAAAESDQANQRRGRPLDAAVRNEYRGLDRAGDHLFGIYDQEFDALVFTGLARPLNHERVMLHEFGHAMTVRDWYRVAHLRADLLLDLPQQIQELLKAYPQGSGHEALRERVLEVLADAYVWVLVGRWAELPPRLLFLMQGVVAGDQLGPA